MSKLFETTTIKNMTLTNRFVRSATWEGMANHDGSRTSELIILMVQLAQGGIGLIITGHAYVRKDGQAGSWQLGVYEDELISGLTEMTEAVHKVGSKIVLQLAHAGCMAVSELTGMEPLGPSLIEKKDGGCLEMTQTGHFQGYQGLCPGCSESQKSRF